MNISVSLPLCWYLFCKEFKSFLMFTWTTLSNYFTFYVSSSLLNTTVLAHIFIKRHLIVLSQLFWFPSVRRDLIIYYDVFWLLCIGALNNCKSCFYCHVSDVLTVMYDVFWLWFWVFQLTSDDYSRAVFVALEYGPVQIMSEVFWI